MRNRFTLIELVISIIVISILLSIVLIKISDLKKQGIASSVSQNTRILQGSVDQYFLENERYPIELEGKLTLTTPQLIDVDLLVEEGFLKKNLDTSKVKNQYYWVDVFGKVWGNTIKDIHSINLFSETNSKRMEFVIGKKVEGYSIYEVLGYNNSAYLNKLNNKFASIDETEKIKDRSYRVIREEAVKSGDKKLINFNLPNAKAEYLISVKDEYGLESPPFGKFSSSQGGFQPLLNKTGVFEFETRSEDIMYWINFQYLAYTPGDSSVNFEFKVLDDKGNYTAWGNDFYILQPSKGIVVKVSMNADDKGNKPSLYDFRLDFKYKDEDKNKLEVLQPEVQKENNTVCPKSPISSDIPFNATKKQTGKVVYSFYVENYFNNGVVPKLKLATGVSYSINEINYLVSLDGQNYVDYQNNMQISEKCMVVVYNVTIENVPPSSIINDICEKTGKCSPEYCKALGECPEKATCEQLNNCHTAGNTDPNEDTGNESGNQNGNNNQNNTENNNENTGDSEKTCIELNNCKKPRPVCGSGSSYNYLENNIGRIVYSYQLEEGASISKLDIPTTLNDFIVHNIYIEYSVDGKPYAIALGIKDVPAGSCFNVVYDYEVVPSSNINKIPTEPSEPVIETCKEDCPKICEEKCGGSTDISETPVGTDWCSVNDCSNDNETIQCINKVGTCIPPVCVKDCSASPPIGPNSDDAELHNPEWKTIDTLRFFAQGESGQLVRWYRAVNDDLVKDKLNTRIVYRYSKMNNYYWSNEYIDFETTGIASSVMAVAYIQVRTNQLAKIKEEYHPIVNKITFYNEQGSINTSATKPTLAIVPIKDNNLNRETFSDKSNIEWTYVAADPRNKEITEVEWAGDIRNNYPVGVYEIKARVKNEVAIWSDWVTYNLEVLQEQPIAVLKFKEVLVNKKMIYQWDISSSEDPDGDKIKSFELINAKETYEIGLHVVKLRVQDNEGYWSDWVEKTINVQEQVYNIYRLEAESNDVQVSKHKMANWQSSNFSGGYGVLASENDSWIEFEFVGEGLDIFSEQPLYYSVDGGEKIHSDGGTTKIRNLTRGLHVVKITVPEDNIHPPFIDYVDVYSSNDFVTIEEVKMNITVNGVDAGNNNTFSILLNQKINYYYKLDKNATEKVTIIDSKDALVKSISNKFVKGGSDRNKTVSWDGKNNSGQVAPNGTYYLLIETVGVNETKSSIKKPIILKNIKPIYRLEAEAENDPQIKYNSTVRWETYYYSEGYGRLFDSENAWVEFNFEGNGFDISVEQPFLYSIDGGSAIKAPSGKTSIRNLTQGKHTLKITYPKGEPYMPFIDYVDVYSDIDKPMIKEIKTVVSRNNVESFVSSSTFSTSLNQKLNFYYELDNDAKEIITIRNESGEIVRSISNKSVKGGTNRSKMTTWDGKNDAKQNVPNGNYYIYIQSEGVNGTVSTFRKKVEVLNSTKAYRLEAETENINITYSNAPIYGNGSFSKSAGRYLDSVDSWIEFKFEGTGFDINVEQEFLYSINGGKPQLAPTGLSSVRNLPKGQYSLKITVPENPTYNPFIDYVDIYN